MVGHVKRPIRLARVLHPRPRRADTSHHFLAVTPDAVSDTRGGRLGSDSPSLGERGVVTLPGCVDQAGIKGFTWRPIDCLAHARARTGAERGRLEQVATVTINATCHNSKPDRRLFLIMSVLAMPKTP